MPSRFDGHFESVTHERWVAAEVGVPATRPRADSGLRDWRDLGRRVLAEALQRTTDELAQRIPPRTASADHLPNSLGSSEEHA